MKPFESRFKCKTKYIMDNINCLEKCDTSQWGPKNIVYISKFKKFGVSIHDCIHVHGKTVVAKSDDFRFNHYNRLETHDTKFCKNKLHIKGFNAKDNLLQKRYSYLKKDLMKFN